SLWSISSIKDPFCVSQTFPAPTNQFLLSVRQSTSVHCRQCPAISSSLLHEPIGYQRVIRSAVKTGTAFATYFHPFTQNIKSGGNWKIRQNMRDLTIDFIV